MEERSLLIVDDETNVINSLKRQLGSEKYAVFAAQSGKAGLNILKERDIAVVVSDYMMPETDGIAFLEMVGALKPDAIRILLTGHGSLENAMDAVNRSHIFGYLIKPWSGDLLKATLERAFEHYELVQENKRLHRVTEEQNEELKRFNRDLETLVRKRTKQLEEAVREGVMMLATAAEAKDDDTGEHVHRIRDLTKRICGALGLSPQRTETISLFSMIHDVGKIHVPDEVLKKPGPLTSEEWELMHQHPVVGAKIIGDKPFYRTAREIARSHHERWDGNGYPDGLKGEHIPLAARIVTVADVFDALTNERPYKKAWPIDEALKEMESLSETVFDPEVLGVFLELLNGA